MWLPRHLNNAPKYILQIAHAVNIALLNGADPKHASTSSVTWPAGYRMTQKGTIVAFDPASSGERKSSLRMCKISHHQIGRYPRRAEVRGTHRLFLDGLQFHVTGFVCFLWAQQHSADRMEESNGLAHNVYSFVRRRRSYRY